MSIESTRPTLTFGFEAEFSSGVDTLTRELFDLELVGDPRQHSYHCDCDHCSLESGFPFRVQNDSSCAGEVISCVFSTRDFDEFTDRAAELQEAAFDSDAVPGATAGFHVHVGGGARPNAAAMGFVLAEAALMEVISPGPLRKQREFNRPSTNRMLDNFHERVSGYGLESAMDFLLDSVQLAWCGDRHSNLWFSSRYETNEFRLWNATAAAWRMEMFVRTSLVMNTAAFLEGTEDELAAAMEEWGKGTPQARMRALDQNTGRWPGSWTTEQFMSRVGSIDQRAAELLERQISFHTTNKAILPTWNPAEADQQRHYDSPVQEDTIIPVDDDVEGDAVHVVDQWLSDHAQSQYLTRGNSMVARAVAASRMDPSVWTADSAVNAIRLHPGEDVELPVAPDAEESGWRPAESAAMRYAAYDPAFPGFLVDDDQPLTEDDEGAIW